MEKKKILTVIGARPQFMKAAAVSREIGKNDLLEEKVVHTGQHYDENMSNLIFKQLSMKAPDYILHSGGMTNNRMIGYLLSELDVILEKERPSMVLVYGDTNSTLAGGLAAKKQNIPVAHVEAGVRNFDESMPEEANRYLTDRLSDINFCVTKFAEENLYKEGFSEDFVNSETLVTGDVMLDIFKDKMLELDSRDTSFLPFDVKNNNYVLATIHRASNVDDEVSLKNIVDSLNSIHTNSLPIVFLVHPRTKVQIEKQGLSLKCFHTSPLGYEETLIILKNCKSVITDSGGLVREAYFASKKSLLILDDPLWPEINKESCSLNIRPNFEAIINAFEGLESLKANFNTNIFGTGNASKKIVNSILEFLK